MIYVSSACIKGNSIREVILQLAKCGIKNIELSGGTDYYEGLEYDLILLKKMYQLNYACHAYFPPPKKPFVVNLASCNDEIYKQSIEHYIHCIELLRRIDCKVLSVHAGFLIEVGVDEIGKKLRTVRIYNESEAYDRFCTAYEYISRLCAQNGIRLWLENNVLSEENYKEFGYKNYMMMTDYHSIMMMKKQLEFHLLLDLGHLHVSANTLRLDYKKECSRLSKYAEWFHISENNAICDEHKPLKEDSEIVREFVDLHNESINVTVESVGTLEEVLKSIRVIANLNTLDGYEYGN